MNCLFLLIILFCCGSNGSCDGRSHGRGNSCRNNCNTGNRGNVARNVGNCNVENRSTVNTNAGSCVVREEYDRQVVRRESDYDRDASSSVHSCPTSSMSRTQFPYLEVEPRTCGCEENQKS